MSGTESPVSEGVSKSKPGNKGGGGGGGVSLGRYAMSETVNKMKDLMKFIQVT